MGKKTVRFKIDVDELQKSKIKDEHKKPCPPDLPNILQKAGVKSFSFRQGGLDWNTVREDAEVLCARLEGISGKE